jgi:hypothetical protein
MTQPTTEQTIVPTISLAAQPEFHATETEYYYYTQSLSTSIHHAFSQPISLRVMLTSTSFLVFRIKNQDLSIKPPYKFDLQSPATDLEHRSSAASYISIPQQN